MLDKNTFGKVAVVYGGWSSEREISLQSGKSVLESLLQSGVQAVGLDVKDSADFQQALNEVRPDRVFIALHGKGGEDGVIQGLLEAMRIPYTGSGILGTSLSINKLASKCIWQNKRLPTPEFIDLGEGFDVENVVSILGLPLAVKPAYEGSSIGISQVTTPEELRSAWESARRHSDIVFAERWVDGNEYSVAFVGDKIFSPIQLHTLNDFYDYQAKYVNNCTKYVCPASLSVERTTALQTLAWRAAQALGVDGWGRVDLRCDINGDFWLLEVNTVPGMTNHSLVPMAAQEADLDFECLVLKILATSCGRKNGADIIYF